MAKFYKESNIMEMCMCSCCMCMAFLELYTICSPLEIKHCAAL